MARGEPQRVHRSVYDRGRHTGYATIISYRDRDLTAFTEGTPHREVVIAGPGERHVALLQRYKEHWLIQCGRHYSTTSHSGELSEEQVLRLAQFALLHADEPGPILAGWLRARIDGMIGDG